MHLKNMETTSQTSGGLKTRLIAFGLGLLVLGIVFGLGLLSSGDIRVIYIAGAVALLVGAIWLGASGRSDWIAAGLLVLPLFAVFVFVVLAQIPALWFVLLFWAVAVTIGLFVVKAVRARARDGLAVVIASAALLACSLWCAVFPIFRNCWRTDSIISQMRRCRHLRCCL